MSVVNIDAHLDVRPLVHPSPHTPAPSVFSQVTCTPLSAPFNSTIFDEHTVFAHSGSPFRQLLEHTDFDGAFFVEFASQGMQCSAEHVDYVHTHTRNQDSVHWLSQLRRATALNVSIPTASITHTPVSKVFAETLHKLSNNHTHHIFVSFDIDAVDGSCAPGVSCPSPIGLTGQEALDMCVEAGFNPHVKLFDLSELCPQAEDYRTPMLAAYMFYHFLCGLTLRLK